ncbi:MAG: sulfite exporter TauE/SafE family protein [Planctomycetota bacterium]
MIAPECLARVPSLPVDGTGVFVCLFLIALLAGFLHAAIGFGYGLVAIGLIPLVMDVHDSHVIVSTASVPVLMGMAWTYREGFEGVPLLQALIGAALGMPLGLWAFEMVSTSWLVRGTGAALLVMIGIALRNRKRVAGDDAAEERSETPERIGEPAAANCVAPGFVAGFLAGAVSIAGPPIAAFALKQPWSPARYKAFLNQFLLAISVLKVGGLVTRGFLDSSDMAPIGLVAFAALLGIRWGARVSDQVDADRFRTWVVSALLAVGLLFLIRG